MAWIQNITCIVDVISCSTAVWSSVHYSQSKEFLSSLVFISCGFSSSILLVIGSAQGKDLRAWDHMAMQLEMSLSAVIDPALNACMCRLLKGLEELNASFHDEGVVASLMLPVGNTVGFTWQF